jgi:hypothetical protein
MTYFCHEQTFPYESGAPEATHTTSTSDPLRLDSITHGIHSQELATSTNLRPPLKATHLSFRTLPLW